MAMGQSSSKSSTPTAVVSHLLKHFVNQGLGKEGNCLYPEKEHLLYLLFSCLTF